jgi:hypothetical protein
MDKPNAAFSLTKDTHASTSQNRIIVEFALHRPARLGLYGPHSAPVARSGRYRGFSLSRGRSLSGPSHTPFFIRMRSGLGAWSNLLVSTDVGTLGASGYLNVVSIFLGPKRISIASGSSCLTGGAGGGGAAASVTTGLVGRCDRDRTARGRVSTGLGLSPPKS